MMKKIKVSLVSLGSLKYPVDIAYLEGWKSSLVSIHHGASVGHLPNVDGAEWERTNTQLRNLLHVDPDADFTLGIINSPLEDNYYMRRLGDKVAVLSLFEMAEIVRLSDFTIENFILRNIYELVVLYAANSALIPAEAHSWTHDDVRGCLFDMNANKSDIVFSLDRPKLCDECTARVKSKQTSSGFLSTLVAELARIHKARYYRISEWVKKHPLWAVLLTSLSAVGLNIIASIIFEKAKFYFSWIA
jgi:hypothetical protein